jgi:UDP-glucose 4-epimerase
MHFLVTGGAGYIGSHAVRLFRERGHDVTVFDNLVYGRRWAVPSQLLVVGDLGDAEALDAVFRRKPIDAVVHFAAFTYVGESVADPARYYRNNTVNAIGLLDACRRYDVKKFVFSSTAAVYGVPERVPIDEACRQQPINPYGRSKLAIEWALDDYALAYGTSFAALRYFNAAGAHPSGEIGENHDPETHLIPLILFAALGLRPQVEMFGSDYPTPDGSCIRDYVHVDDLAEAHLLAVEKLGPNDRWKMNLGTGRGYSVREVIDSCRRISRKTINVKESPRRAGDPPELVAASDFAQKTLGWKPRYTELDAIVETAWRWHSGRWLQLRNHNDSRSGR